MPELPEVETVCRGLQGTVAGKTIRHVRLARSDLRFPFPEHFAERLQERKILRITRRAKYLVFHLSDGLVCLAHLGMSGNFHAQPRVPEKAGKHDHVIFEFSDGSALVFNDPRRFGMMDLVEEKSLAHHKLLKNLGPEPLNKDFTPDYLAQALARRKTAIKVALMDASLVVGVGNIYASEALFGAGIDPRTPAHKTAKDATLLVASIQQVLQEAIASGGSSLRDFFGTDGSAGYFQHRFCVYDRAGKPCFTCGSDIRVLRQSGRSTYFCSKCQHLSRAMRNTPKKPRKTAALRGMKKMHTGA